MNKRTKPKQKKPPKIRKKRILRKKKSPPSKRRKTDTPEKDKKTKVLIKVQKDVVQSKIMKEIVIQPKISDKIVPLSEISSEPPKAVDPPTQTQRSSVKSTRKTVESAVDQIQNSSIPSNRKTVKFDVVPAVDYVKNLHVKKQCSFKCKCIAKVSYDNSKRKSDPLLVFTFIDKEGVRIALKMKKDPLIVVGKSYVLHNIYILKEERKYSINRPFNVFAMPSKYSKFYFQEIEDINRLCYKEFNLIPPENNVVVSLNGLVVGCFKKEKEERYKVEVCDVNGLVLHCKLKLDSPIIEKKLIQIENVLKISDRMLISLHFTKIEFDSSQENKGNVSFKFTNPLKSVAENVEAISIIKSRIIGKFVVIAEFVSFPFKLTSNKCSVVEFVNCDKEECDFELKFTGFYAVIGKGKTLKFKGKDIEVGDNMKVFITPNVCEKLFQVGSYKFLDLNQGEEFTKLFKRRYSFSIIKYVDKSCHVVDAVDVKQ